VAARRASNDQIETATRERKTDISGQQYIFLTNYSARCLSNCEGAYMNNEMFTVGEIV